MNTEENKNLQETTENSNEKVEKEKVVNEDKVDGTEKVETQKATENKVERTYTQAEYEEGVNKAIASKMKGLPTKEEYAEYETWKKGQKEKAESESKYAKENDLLKKEIAVLKVGVADKFQKFVISEVSAMEGDFTENLNKYLEENEEFKISKPKSTGIRINNSETPKENGVREILKRRNPRAFS